LTFGTLLSSQGADAHLTRSLSALIGGNRSTVPEPRQPSKSGLPLLPRALRQSPTCAGDCLTIRDPPRDRPPCGVRSSLPGDRT
jgi:hypothetical protein